MKAHDRTMCTWRSPLGWLVIEERAESLVRVEFADDPPVHPPATPLLQEAVRQLRDYFEGDRRMFDLPMIADGTPFQRRVWLMLEGLPYGRTVTYGQMAGTLGGVRYARAVGAALAATPLLIVRPCHRVVPGSGGLGGYRGGEDRKRALLFLEGINI